MPIKDWLRKSVPSTHKNRIPFLPFSLKYFAAKQELDCVCERLTNVFQEVFSTEVEVIVTGNYDDLWKVL